MGGGGGKRREVHQGALYRRGRQNVFRRDQGRTAAQKAQIFLLGELFIIYYNFIIIRLTSLNFIL